MAHIKAVIYDPPTPGFPFLGVVTIDGEVKLVVPAKSAQQAKAILEEALEGLSAPSLVNGREGDLTNSDSRH